MIRIIDPESLLCIDSLKLGSRGLKSENYLNITGCGDAKMVLQGQSGVVVYNYRKQQSLLFDYTNGLIYPNIFSIQYCNGHLIIGEANKVLYYNTDLYYTAF